MSEQTPKTVDFLTEMKTSLDEQRRYPTDDETQTPVYKTSDWIFRTLQEYSSGKLGGQDTLEGLKILALHTYSSKISGTDILFPSIMASATQVAITENAKLPKI